MFFDFFARRWWQHSKFLRDELRTVALEQGRLNNDRFLQQTNTAHDCKWGHLIRLYIFSALGNLI